MKAKLLFPYRLSHWFGIMLLACTVSHTPMSQTDLLVELDIPVPEPETYATALLLLGILLLWKGISQMRGFSRRISNTLIVIVSLGFGSLQLDAQTQWVSSPISDSWFDSANWTAGRPTSTTMVVFDTSSITSVKHNGDRDPFGIQFLETADPYTITPGPGGGVLYTWSGGITVLGGSANQTFSSTNVRPRVTSSYINNGTGTLFFNFGVHAHLPSDGSAIITFGGDGDIFVSQLQRRTSGMNIDFIKSGNGTLTVSAAASTAATSSAGATAGAWTIQGGVVSINNEANLGFNPAAYNSAGILLSDATLRATASFAIDDSNRGLTLGGTGNFDIPLGNHTLTISNVITGSGGLGKSGNGTLVLSGTNDYTGTTTINAGNLTLSGGAAISDSGTLVLADTAGTILHIALSETLGSLSGGAST